MSNRIRRLRQPDLTPEQIEQMQKLAIYAATGQWSGLDSQEFMDPINDYLDGPSMASILLKNAKAQTLQEQFAEDSKNDAGMGPMIASIRQLDR
jgi:hypothetical protein